MRLVPLFVPSALVVTVLGCGVSVQDSTSSPPQYNNVAPQGFRVQAQAHVASATRSPSVESRVTNVGTQTSNPYNWPVTMTRTGSGPDYAFDGLLDVSWSQAPYFQTCGFRVRHKATARFLGLFPVSDQVTADVAGDAQQRVIVLTAGGSIGAAFPSGGGTVITNPVPADQFVGLISLYHTSLTVKSVRLDCGGVDCASLPSPPVTVNNAPTLPEALPCAGSVVISFTCSPEALSAATGATVEFQTDRGTVRTPFWCEVIGA